MSAANSIPRRLLLAAERFGSEPAYWTRGASCWEATSWINYVGEVYAAARALIALGFQPGQAVGVLGFNRPEWSIMGHAAMLAGGRVAGVYWTSAPEEVDFVLNHAGCPLLLVEDATQYAKVGADGTALPALQHTIAMRGPHIDGVMAWEEFLAYGNTSHDAEIERRLAGLTPDFIGALIYTSGTTGAPKAVALTQAALTWTADALTKALASTPNDRTISYLPLAHIAEQMVSIHAHPTGGYQMYYAKSLETLGEHLKEVHPTIFFGVPRVWERMQKGIQDKLAAATGFKPKLARWAMGVARRAQALRRSGQIPAGLLALQLHVANRLILGKVRTALGLDQARWTYTGAAPISEETLGFFNGLDLWMRQVYGLSETCGPTTLGVSPTTPLTSVGQALPGIELRIADDDELLIKSPNLFSEYLGRPEATAEALQDGWFHSGDLAKIDSQGNVFIIGRKKDILITSGGKNISPANIEAALMDAPLIEHAIVCGDGRHFLSALVTLNPDVAVGLAGQSNNPNGHPAVLAAVQKAIDQVNAQHARVANIRKFTVLDSPLSIERGELTATLKVRRHNVIKRHEEKVKAMYDS